MNVGIVTVNLNDQWAISHISQRVGEKFGKPLEGKIAVARGIGERTIIIVVMSRFPHILPACSMKRQSAHIPIEEQFQRHWNRDIIITYMTNLDIHSRQLGIRIVDIDAPSVIETPYYIILRTWIVAWIDKLQVEGLPQNTEVTSRFSIMEIDVLVRVSGLIDNVHRRYGISIPKSGEDLTPNLTCGCRLVGGNVLKIAEAAGLGV